MHMGHEIDMVVDTRIHHTWRSHDLNNERLWSDRLCADHVPGGAVIKHGERSCRYNEGIREHAMVWSMHREDIIISRNRIRISVVCTECVQT
jgi:hypothetical protein